MVSFKMKKPDTQEERVKGIAVAMTPFMAMIVNSGLDVKVSQDRVKQEIRNHGLGITTNSKQVFNVEENGETISRSKTSTEKTQHKNCILVKKSVFGPGAWQKFAACKYHSLIVLVSHEKTKVIYYINCSGIASCSKSRKTVSLVWMKMTSTHCDIILTNQLAEFVVFQCSMS